MSCFSLEDVGSDILQEIIAFTRPQERLTIKSVNSCFRACVDRQTTVEIRSKKLKRGLHIYVRVPAEFLTAWRRYSCRLAVVHRIDWNKKKMCIQSSVLRASLWCDIFEDYGVLWVFEHPFWEKKLGLAW